MNNDIHVEYVPKKSMYSILGYISLETDKRKQKEREPPQDREMPERTQSRGIITKTGQHQCYQQKSRIRKRRRLTPHHRPSSSRSSLRTRLRQIHSESPHAPFPLWLSLFEEWRSGIPRLETPGRHSSPESSHPTTCPVDLLVLSPSSIVRRPLHHCRRDLD